MLDFFTKNLDTMGRTTKKKNLGELDDLSRLKKAEMDQLFGGDEKISEKKKSGFFSGLFNPGPCEGELPQ